MNLSDVALFCAIVTPGSPSAAERQAGLSPMAVSRRLAALEHELGVRLIHCTTRPVALTADGETFLPLAQTMLEVSPSMSPSLPRRERRGPGNRVRGLPLRSSRRAEDIVIRHP